MKPDRDIAPAAPAAGAFDAQAALRRYRGQAKAESAVLLAFDGLSAPVRLCNCASLLDALPAVLHGWAFNADVDADRPPQLRLSRNAYGYLLETPLLPDPVMRSDPVDAACAFAAELARAYVHENDRLLCLHGAAAEFAGKLVVFPSDYRSGKSILCASLAAAGVRLFGDDVLPLRRSDGYGVAAGLALRLRNPVPGTLAAKTRRFIEDHTSLRGNNYRYLALSDSQMAPRGTALPVGAFVLPEREAGAVARLEPVEQADVLRRVVWQNFAREAEAPAILESLDRLVASTRHWRLRYDRAEDAVELLRESFGHWPETSTAGTRAATPASRPIQPTCGLAPGKYRQKPGIRLVDVNGQSFLADPNGAAIHHLNPVGGALWRLFAEPATAGEAAAILARAFTDLEPERARNDVDRLVAELEDKGLLESGG